VPQPLPGGLVLRAAQPADVDQIVALLTERGDAADAVDHQLIVDDPDAGWESCAVVVHGDRIVSTATLLDETLVLSGVSIAAGQVELVATDRAYEGRGLVRALMDWAHERSARRGHLVQVMIGIPYFYRLFGYQYSIVLPQARAVQTVPPLSDDHAVRQAGPGDIAAMTNLQDATQRAYDLSMPHSPACWRWLVARDGTTQLLVERDGVAVATGRITPPDDGDVTLGEVAAVDPAAAYALLAHAATRTGAGDLAVKERPGCVGGDALDRFLAPPPQQAERYYTRIPDVATLLNHLRPVLSARLAASDLAGDSGDAVVSFFRQHVRLPYAKGAVGEVETGGRMQAPGTVGGAGVAPDMVGPLLFGPHGIGGLAERHADVYPGRSDILMRTLFPPVRADLLTFYLP
jgi:predicted N-acetyltransferase YhbS